MRSEFHHPIDVMRFALDLANRKRAFALVVAMNVTGGTLRATGALMCVPAMGPVAGYISNGCVDADIIFQAREAIKQGEPCRLIYGEGSPFKDISLPCGGRIELGVIPHFDAERLVHCFKRLSQRQSTRLEYGFEGFSYNYTPKLRLRIAGKGEAVRGLARQAIETGFEVWLQSPEPDMADGLDVAGFDHLVDTARPPHVRDDPWTAVILMFHDHDWEPSLLEAAIAGPAFYIGAMGSMRTHEARLSLLKARGVAQENLDRIAGPIGLVPSMRDANLLALSTLGEIVKVAQEKGRL